MGETLLTPAQVATQLGVKPPKVRELIRHRKLSAINIGSALRPTWRVSVADLDAFQCRNRTVPQARHRRSVAGLEKVIEFV